MAKYIMLVSWTDQGIKGVKDSPARADKVRELGRSLGVELQQLYMVMGEYDLVTIAEAPSDEAMAKFVLKTGMSGNVRTRTLKAFDEADYRRILGEL